MTHAPDEVLAALALGDTDVDPVTRAHVDGCPVCSEEVSELAHVHDSLRAEASLPAPHLDAPGPNVWQRIVAETANSETALVESTATTSTPALELLEDRTTARTASEPTLTDAHVTGADDDTHTGSVIAMREPGLPGRSGRHERATVRKRAPWLFVAAAACLIVGALVGRALWNPSGPSSSVVSSVPLTSLDVSRQQEGTAQLLDSRGVSELRVDTNPMSVSSGFVEVWLINTDGKRMVSLGVLSSTQAVFPVPVGAIGQGYTIVDLSHEQFDDKPAHSGDSIMRGTLPA